MKTVGYCRLSRDDGDNESQSITNQRKIISKYAQENGLTIDEWYIDDGVSGYSMDRPSFNRLKNDLNMNNIDMVIVKDLSRLGRHNAGVNLFLENMTNSGKVVVAINDNYYSYNEQCNDIVGIQTWINEKYVKDTSRKIRKSIRAMQAEGKYVPSVPYGYKMNPLKKGDYMVDERTAKYVKMAFEMYINGNGLNVISRTFKEMGVPTSTMIMKQDIEARGGVYRGKVSTVWTTTVISRMLQNTFYIGTLTLNKTQRRSINGKKVEQSEDDYIVFPNHHEPIIDNATFNLVQEIRGGRKQTAHRGYRKNVNPFAGLLYCADCGARLTSMCRYEDERYFCTTYKKLGTKYCTSHIIRESELTECIRDFLTQCLDNLDEALSRIDDIIKEELKRQSSNNGCNVSELNSQLSKLKLELQQLFEQKMNDTLANPELASVINENYSNIITQKSQMIKSLELQINDCVKDDNIKIDKSKVIGARSLFEDILNSEKFTKKQLFTIIKKIDVHEDGGLDIYLKANLQKIVDTKINYKKGKQEKLLIDMINYMYSKDMVSATPIYRYVKNERNHALSYERFRRIIEDYIRQGFIKEDKRKIIKLVPKEVILDYSNIIPIRNTASWSCSARDIISIMLELSDWYEQSNNNKKFLF